MALRISIDTGGTFTDVVVVDEQGAFHVGKALTTPQRIFQGIHGALDVVAEQLGVPVRDLLARSDMLIYGTTRATNAVVTKRTAKTAFLTTRGFKDTLTLKEGGKHGPHDYSYDYPDPYIPRRLQFRNRRAGLAPTARSSCRSTPRAGGGVLELLRDRSFEAVAVCAAVVDRQSRARARARRDSGRGCCRACRSRYRTSSIPVLREYRRASVRGDRRVAEAADAAPPALDRGRAARARALRGALVAATSMGGVLPIEIARPAADLRGQIRARRWRRSPARLTRAESGRR